MIRQILVAATASAAIFTSPACEAFVSPWRASAIHNANDPSSSSSLNAEQVGIFFGTSTGSTEEAAQLLSEAFGSGVASEPIDIDGVDDVAAELGKYPALVCGTPTWNTGADTERSGTGWDEIYYTSMQDLDIAGKKVAVFGLGDSVSYSENYADGCGELHDVFSDLGCVMLGYTSQEGYQHDSSKAIRGDKFCGLLLDAVNEEDLTDERVSNWVSQLMQEGILDTNGGAVASATPAEVAPAVVEDEAPVFVDPVLAQEIMNEVKPEGYRSHYNPRTDKTMWISADGRSSYVTEGGPGHE